MFSNARKDEGGSWVVDFGRGWFSVKYGTPHTDANAQKVEHSQSSVDRMIQHGAPRGLEQDVRQ